MTEENINVTVSEEEAINIVVAGGIGGDEN